MSHNRTQKRITGMPDKLAAYMMTLTEGSKKTIFNFRKGPHINELFNNRYYFFFKERKNADFEVDPDNESNFEENPTIYYGKFNTPNHEESIVLKRNLWRDENEAMPDDDMLWLGSNMTDLLIKDGNKIKNVDKNHSNEIIFNEDNNIYLYRFLVLDKFFTKEEIKLKTEIIKLAKLISHELGADITTWLFHEPDPEVYFYNILKKKNVLLNMYVKPSNMVERFLRKNTLVRKTGKSATTINAEVSDFYTDALTLIQKMREKRLQEEKMKAEINEKIQKMTVSASKLRQRIEKIKEEDAELTKALEELNKNKGGKRKTKKHRKHSSK